MKNVILSAVLMFILTSCATTTKVPVSGVTPAAVISLAYGDEHLLN